MSENNSTQIHLSQQALNRAVREAAEYIRAEGWDHAPSLFALIPTIALAGALADELTDSAPLTVVTQEPLPEGVEGGNPEPVDFIARTSQPAGVVGAVLTQGIMVIAPEQADSSEDVSLDEVRAQADDEAAHQARLFSGVISKDPHLTLIQPHPTEVELSEHGLFAEDEIELKDGSGVADGVIAALYSMSRSAS